MLDERPHDEFAVASPVRCISAGFGENRLAACFPTAVGTVAISTKYPYGPSLSAFQDQGRNQKAV